MATIENRRRRIHWRIRRLDRTTREFSDRDLVLDQATITAEQFADILRILDNANFSRRHEIRKYRQCFKDASATHGAGEGFDAIHSFCLPDYFEDDAGNPLSIFEMMKVKTGQDDIIVLGDLDSVLRIGPVPIVDAHNWNVDKANIVAHFVEVALVLSRSNWARSAVSVSSIKGKDGTSTVIGSRGPDVLTINSVLGFVRQLAASDRLFERASEAYLAHTSDDGKKLWVQHEKDMFDKVLEDPNALVGRNLGMPGKKLLRHFFYSFGLLHTPEPDQVKEFRQLVEQHGQHWFMMAFNMTMQHLVAHATSVAIVLNQDVQRWFKEGVAMPDRISIADVLGTA